MPTDAASSCLTEKTKYGCSSESNICACALAVYAVIAYNDFYFRYPFSGVSCLFAENSGRFRWIADKIVTGASLVFSPTSMRVLVTILLKAEHDSLSRGRT